MSTLLQRLPQKHIPASKHEVVPINTDQDRVLKPDAGPRSRLAFLTDTTGIAVEQYKILCRRVLTAHPKGGVLMITSPGPGEGKTMTSLSLAWALARSGRRTCLVDLDLRAPGVLKALGARPVLSGVDDVLKGSKSVTDCLHRLDGTQLQVLPVRHRREMIENLLAPDSLKPVIDELRLSFEWIVLDYAPAIPMADVGDGLCNVDGALLVVRSGKTRKSMIPAALEVLGSKNWGVVLNDAQILGSAYYGSYGKDRP